MRRKTPKTIVTFASNSDAMSLEERASRQGIPGRIIPVPTQISAGCGLAWCVEEADRQTLLDDIARFEIAHEGIFVVQMY